MRVGEYDKAIAQAKANAKLIDLTVGHQVPWVVFSWNFAWHCESMISNRGNNTVVMPDGSILSHNEFMEQYSQTAWCIAITKLGRN